MAVGVFDSGLGGLTVLDAVVRRLPNVPFVYYGDNAHTPSLLPPFLTLLIPLLPLFFSLLFSSFPLHPLTFVLTPTFLLLHPHSDQV